MNPLELTLGIMTAVGGFVDISELVFAAKAGSTFGYALIWVFAFSTVGIIVFCGDERTGRRGRQAAGVQPDAPPAGAASSASSRWPPRSSATSSPARRRSAASR